MSIVSALLPLPYRKPLATAGFMPRTASGIIPRWSAQNLLRKLRLPCEPLRLVAIAQASVRHTRSFRLVVKCVVGGDVFCTRVGAAEEPGIALPVVCSLAEGFGREEDEAD
jgi:hypothetical protein